MRALLRSVIVAIVSIYVADNVVLPWYFSFMDVMCADLSAKIANQVDQAVIESSRCWWWMWYGDIKELQLSDGLVRLFCRWWEADHYLLVVWWVRLGLILLVPWWYCMLCLFNWLTWVVVVVLLWVFLWWHCVASAVLDVRQHPNAWSSYLLNIVPHIHFWFGWWWVVAFCIDKWCEWFVV